MRRTGQGFTRIELAVAVTMLAALGLFALPVLAGSRVLSDRVACFNNLRQIMRAALMFADENHDSFPPRSGPRFWPGRLLQYYGSTNLLTCPADGPTPKSLGITNADGAPRSYIMNGWGDYYSSRGLSPTNVMPLSAILEPAQTIVFGEKQADSGHFWMDYFQGDDFVELDQSRHFASKPNGPDGASQYAFADGSVRLLKFGESLYPILLWAVEPEWRTNGWYGP
jgi:prepilin-type processing-associated H-X9-DG protein